MESAVGEEVFFVGGWVVGWGGCGKERGGGGRRREKKKNQKGTGREEEDEEEVEVEARTADGAPCSFDGGFFPLFS